MEKAFQAAGREKGGILFGSRDIAVCQDGNQKGKKRYQYEITLFNMRMIVHFFSKTSGRILMPFFV